MIQTEKITGYFKDEVDLVQHCTFKQTSNPYISSLNLDFIISTSPLNVITKTPVYIVHPIITDRDIDYLKSKIQKLFNQKRKNLIRQHLYKFVDHSLFKKNFYEDSYISMIKDLCYEVQLKGYIDDNFMPDVIKREELYSTSFDNIVAIPHTLSVNAKKSFFSIVLNDKKIAWGDTYVNIIILVGINDNDLSSFRLIFDWLVNILTDRSHYSLLLKSKDYDDFINNLFCNM